MYRRILFFLLAVLFCSIFASRSYASSINFIKDTHNPLNANFFLLQSTVAKENEEYKMWFTGSNAGNLKIGYATSVDGIDWPTQSFVAVNDTGDNHDPSLFENGGNRYLYYISEPAEGSGVDIKVHRSLVSDSVLGNPTLINLPRQPWNSQKLSCPYGYFENGTYFLFYCGTSGNGWHLGLATSTNGIDFTPCSNNPIISDGSAGNSQIYQDEIGKKHLLYHSGSGIAELETGGALTCDSVWSFVKILIPKDSPYDQTQIIAPSLVNSEGQKELFYTARGPATNNEWRLNRAVENINTKSKIVIVPGFFASWNKDAMLHNANVANSEWKIPSYIHEYDGIAQTLKNLNYEEDSDYYLFPYDWRKSINETTEDLHSFLQNKIWNYSPSQKVNLVGHSMGGLVTRIFDQKYTDDRVVKIVTAASPHKGVIQVYPPLEAGETFRDNSLLWFGTKLLVNLNRKLFNNDRTTVRTIIPSLFDLFPTFNFLKNSNGTYKQLNTLSI